LERKCSLLSLCFSLFPSLLPVCINSAQ
jgi:hypothetical protein